MQRRPTKLGFEVEDLAAVKDHLTACVVREYHEESMGGAMLTSSGMATVTAW
jgi:hypothetical protein